MTLRPPERPTGPRVLVGLLSLVSFVAYPLRSIITVAAAGMMPELRLTQVQMGDVFSAFQLPYALGQIPGGFLGDRFGARRVLTGAVLVWAVAALLIGAVPAGLGVGATLALLWGAQALMGLGQAPTYPVGTMAIERHVPGRARGRAVAVFLAAAVIGSTLTPVAVSQTMARWGWRAAFGGAAVLALLIGAVWHRAAPRAPARPAGGEPLRHHGVRALRLLRDRRLQRLALSYMCQSAVWFLFVYWFYIYLTDVRGFSILKGGLFGAAPYLAALVLGPLGGTTLDLLIRRHGKTRGRRATAMTGMIASAACVIVGARLNNPYFAIAALALSSGMINFVEAAFWTTAAELGGEEAGTAGGILNTLGNLGGLLATSAVPRMVGAWGWIPSMLVFGGVAVSGALLWLTFTPERTTEG